MPESLASLRKSKKLSQQELGERIAARLGQRIEGGYAQKKISRLEKGNAIATTEELRALAQELGVDEQIVRMALTPDGPNEATAMIDGLRVSAIRRSLMAVCCMSRSRPQMLDANLRAMELAILKNNFAVAVFVPYPNILNLPEHLEYAGGLTGHYTRIRKSVSDANLIFKNAVGEPSAKRIALYFPRAELMKSSVTIIPPTFRQYSLMLEESRSTGVMTKSLQEWIPSTEKDIFRPILATGVHSLEEQIEAWEALFGDVLQKWIETDELIPGDGYWERVR